MPYRNAHWYVLGLLITTFVAFWPRYLSQLPAGKPDWHVHAAGALLWVLLVILQTWSIQAGKRNLHRSAGLSIFILFPLFLVGGAMAIQAEAADLAAGMDNPRNVLIGPFGFFDPLANIGFAVLFYCGIKHRRNIQLHSSFLIATLLFLVEPVVLRLLANYVPFFNTSDPEMTYRLAYAVAVGNATAIVISLFLYWRSPGFGRPFLIVVSFIVTQELLFETIGRTDEWAVFFSRLANANTTLLLAATGVASLALIWHAWLLGNQSRRS